MRESIGSVYLTRFSFVIYSGRTQIAAGSRTVLGIGPGQFRFHLFVEGVTKQWRTGPARLINQVTSKLRLL